MKKIILAVALLLGLGAMVSCNKDNASTSILGTWKFVVIESYADGKLYDSYTPEPGYNVTVMFREDGVAELVSEDTPIPLLFHYQMTGSTGMFGDSFNEYMGYDINSIQISGNQLIITGEYIQESNFILITEDGERLEFPAGTNQRDVLKFTR